MHFLGNEEKEEWIKVCVEGETARATKQVPNVEAPFQPEQDATTKT
jgi:hypothetical protein